MRRPILLLFIIVSTLCHAQQLTLQELGLKAPVISNCTPVKDQYLSSTCWSFSSVSLLESELMKMGKGQVNLSEMFIARYSMLRKIQRHLKLKGGNFFTPGGQFHDVIWVIRNYGIVTEEAYSGKPDAENNHDHGELDTLLSRYVKDLVSKGVTATNAQQQFYIDSVLDHYLGKLPTTFTYHGRSYTPKTFLQQALQFNPDDYVEITSYTHHPFYSKFALEDKYNWTNDEYYNVTMDDFSRITDNALATGYTVGWDGDAEDTYFDYYKGIAYLPDSIGDFQTYRQKAFEDGTTLLDHMMHIVASVKDASGKKWYYIKNSWGYYSNPLDGFMFMRDDYFKIRTVAIIVNKKAIPPDIRRKLSL